MFSTTNENITMKKNVVLVCLSLLYFGAGYVEVEAAQMYTIKIIDPSLVKIIGTYPSSIYSLSPVALNAKGQILGNIEDLHSKNHVIFYDGNSLRDIGTLGGPSAIASGINDTGQIVGLSETNTYPVQTHAFQYDGINFKDLTALNFSGLNVNIRSSNSFIINNNGQIAGVNEKDHAFLYDGTLYDLGTLDNTEPKRTSGAFDINNKGQVVGFSSAVPYLNGYLYYSHAMLYDNKGMHDLGTLGGDRSFALAINESGQIVGVSGLADGRSHAFLYDSTGMHDLGALGQTYQGFNSRAVDINASGKIVGYSGTKDDYAGFSSLAVVYDSEGLHDLNTLLVSKPANMSSLNKAIAINDSGQILATTQYGTTVLLTPASTDLTVTLTASSNPVNYNGSTTLTWSSANANKCSATSSDGFSGDMELSGSVTLTETATTTYTVTCTGTTGTQTQTLTVTVNSPAECLFNWAESNYPSLFAPAAASLFSSPYSYRYYKNTDSYVGVSANDNHVYYLDANRVLQDVGTLSAWLLTAGCE